MNQYLYRNHWRYKIYKFTHIDKKPRDNRLSWFLWFFFRHGLHGTIINSFVKIVNMIYNIRLLCDSKKISPFTIRCHIYIALETMLFFSRKNGAKKLKCKTQSITKHGLSKIKAEAKAQQGDDLFQSKHSRFQLLPVKQQPKINKRMWNSPVAIDKTTNQLSKYCKGSCRMCCLCRGEMDFKYSSTGWWYKLGD